MQNFWWNRKFYHGKEEPDSFRLHRLEEEQTAATAAVESLSKAQTALEQLLTTHDSLLSEHTGLLSDLTAIAATLRDELEAVSVECDSIGSELLVLENNDAALSARLDGVEEACADTAAEQSTQIGALEKETAALAPRIDALEEQLSGTSSEEGMAFIKGTTSTGRVYVRGLEGGSTVQIYESDGTGILRYMPSKQSCTVALCDESNLITGNALELYLQSVGPAEVEIMDPPLAAAFDANYCNVDLVFPATPCLTTIGMEGTTYVSNSVVDLSGQTGLRSLNIAGTNATIIPPDLSGMTFEDDTGLRYLTMDSSLGSDEEFLKKLLPTRSETYPGRLEVYGGTSLADAAFLAERHWRVEEI